MNEEPSLSADCGTANTLGEGPLRRLPRRVRRAVLEHDRHIVSRSDGRAWRDPETSEPPNGRPTLTCRFVAARMEDRGIYIPLTRPTVKPKAEAEGDPSLRQPGDHHGEGEPMAVSMTLVLERQTLTNVDDAAGRWQHEGGTAKRGTTVVANYATTRRVTNGGTNSQNTAMLTTTLFFTRKEPAGEHHAPGRTRLQQRQPDRQRKRRVGRAFPVQDGHVQVHRQHEHARHHVALTWPTLTTTTS